jgi:hypothetical protein
MNEVMKMMKQISFSSRSENRFYPIPQNKIHLESVIEWSYSDSKDVETFTCVLHTEKPPRQGYLDVYIGNLWFRANKDAFLEVKAFFNQLAKDADIDGNEITDFDKTIMGTTIEVVDDGRIGIYIYDSLVACSELLDRKFLPHIADWLNSLSDDLFDCDKWVK